MQFYYKTLMRCIGIPAIMNYLALFYHPPALLSLRSWFYHLYWEPTSYIDIWNTWNYYWYHLKQSKVIYCSSKLEKYFVFLSLLKVFSNFKRWKSVDRLKQIVCRWKRNLMDLGSSETENQATRIEPNYITHWRLSQKAIFNIVNNIC